MAELSIARDPRRFYVYMIFDLSGIPRYVGKGSGARWKRRDRHCDNPHLANIFKAAGGSLPIVKVRERLTEDEAFETEKALISAIGREAFGGTLTNVTDGGEGTSGAVMSAEWRERRRAIAKAAWEASGISAKIATVNLGNTYRKGKRHTPEWKAANADRMRGNSRTLGLIHSDAARQKMSIARKGKPKSAKHAAAIGAAHRGMKRSAETRAKIGAALRGRTQSLEARAAISAALKGKPKPRKPVIGQQSFDI